MSSLAARPQPFHRSAILPDGGLTVTLLAGMADNLGAVERRLHARALEGPEPFTIAALGAVSDALTSIQTARRALNGDPRVLCQCSGCAVHS